jgi:hypothetical protein
VRVGAAEALEESRQEFARHRLVDAEPHRALVRAVQDVDFRAGQIELVDRLAHPIEQRLARGGESQAFAIAREQLDLELLLQQLDLPTDGGGGDVDAVGRQPKRAVLCDLVEISQCRRVHEIRQKTQRHRAWTSRVPPR